MSEWIFHKDCVHYDSVTKEPRPEGKHKSRIYAKCHYCGYGMHYFNDSDFENLKTQCKYYEPRELKLQDFLKE